MTDAIRAAFRTQAGFCRALHAPFTAALLEALAETIDDDTRTGAKVLGWTGDPLNDALTLRLTGGLHALARLGDDPEWTAIYRAQAHGFAETLRRVMRDRDEWLYPWLDSPPQTNEVGRSGALMPGLMVAARYLEMPIELLELGSSAGLNLHLDRFGYDLGGLAAGDAGSAVSIAPVWTGEPPAGNWPRIAARAGVDRNPLDVRDDAIAERLLAYCWPDQPERLTRLEAAIALARSIPVDVAAGDAADWIERRLAMPQDDGRARIVMHSVFWQYLTSATQERISNAMQQAGQRATDVRPLAWLTFEPEAPAIGPMQLKLRQWPGDETLHLATCHPHGTQVGWHRS